MPKWYQRAVTAKLELYPLAKRLLMSTGAALLADCHQPCGCDERQLMRVMSRPYGEIKYIDLSWGTVVNGKLVVQWMADPKQCPRTLQSAFKENSTGVLLMRLRQRLIDAADDNQVLYLIFHFGLLYFPASIVSLSSTRRSTHTALVRRTSQPTCRLLHGR